MGAIENRTSWRNAFEAFKKLWNEGFSMDSKDLIKAGRLSEARKQLAEEVKSTPGDIGRRTLLFQVLAYCGEWEKAERHLDLIAAQETKSETGVQVYKNLIRAEKERIEVSRSLRRPSFLPEAPPYSEVYFMALENLRLEKFDDAKKTFDRIDAERSPLTGTIDGKRFKGFKDTDTFLSLFLEAIVYERYVWVPLDSVREIVVSPPKTLLDLLWIPAHLTCWEGFTASGYLPVLYPDTFLHEEDRVKLGRMTDWKPLGNSFSKAMGRHVFETGKEESVLLDFQEVLFKRAKG
jgi:type VI secretion system protein ImpE